MFKVFCFFKKLKCVVFILIKFNFISLIDKLYFKI